MPFIFPNIYIYIYILFFQGDIDLDEEAGKLPPFPQIVVVQHDSKQFYIVVEKQVLLESGSVKDSLIDLISVYFTFDIAYPKLPYPVCLFLQHHVLGIIDKQRVPNSVTILLSSLDNY